MDVRVGFDLDSRRAGRDGGQTYYISGEMTLTGLSAVGVEQDRLLQWDRLLITVPISASQRRVVWDGFAQYFASSIAATTNGVVSFAFQFRLFGGFSTIGDTVAI